MRSRSSSRFSIQLLIAVPFALPMACGGSTATPAAPAAEAGSDASSDTYIVKPDAGAEVAAEVGSKIDISGSLDISLRVVKPTSTTSEPQAGFSVRAENAAGGYVEGTTDADGTAHLKVDASKGPFDVTAAKKGFGAVSILGATAPLGDVIVYELGAEPRTPITITGKIAGKLSAANQVQIDAWAFSTVVAKPTDASYSSKFTIDPSFDLPIPLAGLEVDSTGKVVNGVLTSSISRKTSAMTVDVTFPTTALTPTNTTLTVKFPSTGVITGSVMTKVAKLTSGDTVIGNVMVSKTNKFAEMFVGVGNVDVPTSGTSTIKLQTFGGELAPDLVSAGWSGSGGQFARVSLTNLADAASVELGVVKTLEVAGADLGDVTFAIEGDSSWDSVEFGLSDSDGVLGTVWRCYSASSKIDTRGLPHLPTTVKLSDLGSVTSLDPLAIAWRRTKSTTPLWSDNTRRDAVVSKRGDALDVGGR